MEAQQIEEYTARLGMPKEPKFESRSRRKHAIDYQKSKYRQDNEPFSAIRISKESENMQRMVLMLTSGKV